MFNGWTDSLLAGLQTLNNILTAGIAITAFSLFLYALSFNLRDRVARSFAIILLCVVVVFTTEALQNKDPCQVGESNCCCVCSGSALSFFHLRIYIFGCVLVTAGRPSRGRRRIAVRLVYAVSVGFLVLLSMGVLVGGW